MTAVALSLAGCRSAVATALSTRATKSHRFEATALAALGPRKWSSWRSAGNGPPSPRTTSSSASQGPPPRRSLSSRTETTSTATSGGAAAGRDASTRGKKASADSDEVEKFSSMAGNWWDHRSNPLIGMNPTRVSRMVHVLNNSRAGGGGRRQQQSQESSQHRTAGLPLAGLRALDVGCGGGLLSESLARLGADVTAIDPSEEIVDAARRHSVEFLDGDVAARIDYRGGTTVEDLADEVVGPGWRRDDAGEGIVSDGGKVGVQDRDDDGLFDVICILEVLEHAPDPARLLTAASALLKRRPPASVDGDSDLDNDDESETGGGGTLFVSTINRTAKSYLLAVVGAEYVAGMLPPGTHDWNRFLSPKDVEGMAKPLGLNCVDLCGMVPVPEVWPPPTSLSFASMLRWTIDEGDTDVNWIGAYAHR